MTVGHKGKEFGKDKLYRFLEQNFDYDTAVEMLSNRYCSDPKLMEYIAWKYHGTRKDQKKLYWSKALKPYSDIRVLVEDGYIVIDGDLPGVGYINFAIDDMFDRYVKKLKAVQSKNDDINGYSINGKDGKTLYDVMHLFRSYIPKGVERFKGLGELEAHELKKLCMDPETRTVIIFKFKDFAKDMDKISMIMSSRDHYDEARAKYVGQFSIDASDLDT